MKKKNENKMLKFRNPRHARTPISMITSKYDETLFSKR